MDNPCLAWATGIRLHRFAPGATLPWEIGHEENRRATQYGRHKAASAAVIAMQRRTNAGLADPTSPAGLIRSPV